MAVSKWKIEKYPNAKSPNQCVLKIRGSRDDILFVFNMLMQDCEVPYSIHTGEEYNWGLVFTDPKGEVSEEIKKQLLARGGENSVSPESKRQKETEDLKKIEITDYYADIMEESGKYKVEGNSRSDRFPPIIEAGKSESDVSNSEEPKLSKPILDKTKQDKPKTSSSEEETQLKEQHQRLKEDIYAADQRPKVAKDLNMDKEILEPKENVQEYNQDKLAESSKDQKWVNQPQEVEKERERKDKEKGSDSDKVEMKNLLDELNEVFSDLTKSERDKMREKLTSDFDAISKERRRRNVFGEESTNFEKDKGDVDQKPRPSNETLPREAFSEDKFDSKRNVFEIENRDHMQTRLGQKRDNIPNSMETNSNFPDTSDRSAESFEDDFTNKQVTPDDMSGFESRGAENRNEQPDEGQSITEEVKKDAKLQEILRNFKQQKKMGNTQKDHGSYDASANQGDSYIGKAQQQDEIKQKPEYFGKEPHEQPMHAAQKFESPSPINICCVCPSNEKSGFQLFQETIEDVIEKTTKTAFYSNISLSIAMNVGNPNIQGIIDEIKSVNVDVVILIDEPAISRAAINQLTLSLSQLNIPFYSISKSKIGKKFVYVDLVVELMLKKKNVRE
ncbi:MAG: hypothetical protein ABII27_02740 [bacterium]